MLYNRRRRFFGLREAPDDSDYVIAADAGFEYCTENCIIPDLVLGDFDSLGKAPKHPNVLQLPVEKDDTDTMFALKLGLEKGYRRFYIYGGLGGKRPDHTIANMQALLFLLSHGARGWLFGENYVWTAIKIPRCALRARVTLRYSALTAKQRAFR